MDQHFGIVLFFNDKMLFYWIFIKNFGELYVKFLVKFEAFFEMCKTISLYLSSQFLDHVK